MSLDDLPETLLGSRANWIEAVNSGDLDAYTELVSDAVIWFAPGHVPIEGRAAFRDWIAPLLRQYQYEFSVESLHCQVAGRWMVEEARFQSRMSARSDGATFSHEGRMLIFWHNVTDARWRIDRYVDLGVQS